MTREEAIAYFKDMNECTYGDVEPVQMAIKALEQEPCEDAVSRKAVVNLILEDAVRTGIGHRYTSIQNMNNEINEVRSLPSITPTRKKGKWIPCRANEECPLKESEEK